jgi:hypothetical protein
MTDPAATIARAVATRLSDEYGPNLAVNVETEIHSLRHSQYVDPVAIASLIVSVANLAWTVYIDLKRATPKVQADVLARSLRVTLREKGGPLTPNQERVLDVVVVETLDHEP